MPREIIIDTSALGRKARGINTTKKSIKKLVKKDVNKILSKSANMPRKKRRGIPRNFLSNPPKNVGLAKYSSFNKDCSQHIINLMDPWAANEARWFRDQLGKTHTAKPITSFKITSNSAGNLMVYFDPDFANPSTGSYTSFVYNSDGTLSGSASLATATYTPGPIGSCVVPPGNTVLRLRLVSCGVKATVKLSELNMVGTVYTCYDYGDSIPAVAGGGEQAAANFGPSPQIYSLFQNCIQNGGTKRDITAKDNSVIMTWFPMDPTAEVFLDPGASIAENGTDPVDSIPTSGGSPKMVFCFEALGNGTTTTVEFEIVWNFEYLSNPVATPWVGGASNGIAKNVHENIKSIVLQNMKTSYNEEEYNEMESILSHLDESNVNGSMYT